MPPKGSSKEGNAPKSRKRKASQDYEFGSDDDSVPQSQASSSQNPNKKRKGKETLTDKQERDKLVGDLVRYAIFMDFKKNPLRREDINKNIMKEHKGSTSQVLPLAQERLKDIFGFDLVEVKRSTKKTQKAAASAGIFVLKNNLELPNGQSWYDFVPPAQEEDDNSADSKTPSANSERGLLMAILGLIYLNNQEIDKDSLYTQLRRLGMRENEPHFQFGQWEKIVEKFVKELYLEKKRTTQQGKDGKTLYNYRIGQRALMEIGKKRILYFIANTYGEDQPDAAELQELEMEDEPSDSESGSDSDSSDSDSEPEPSQSQGRGRGRASSQSSQKGTPSPRGRGRGRG
eukprot:TRINITY_DN3964_c0_g1_i1.p1 TRINITY_DN3964_c0_g1~~TRINITY_DN3964_c0_g1_i1.p1  ORF type:complete len:345 (-),score=80.65 TRINITY_DN3964_c0_g1_i1:10-1044(-)